MRSNTSDVLLHNCRRIRIRQFQDVDHHLTIGFTSKTSRKINRWVPVFENPVRIVRRNISRPLLLEYTSRWINRDETLADIQSIFWSKGQFYLIMWQWWLKSTLITFLFEATWLDMIFLLLLYLQSCVPISFESPVRSNGNKPLWLSEWNSRSLLNVLFIQDGVIRSPGVW